MLIASTAAFAKAALNTAICGALKWAVGVGRALIAPPLADDDQAGIKHIAREAIMDAAIPNPASALGAFATDSLPKRR